MSKFTYVDDLLADVINKTLFQDHTILSKDYQVLESIFNQLSINGQITQLQATLVVRLLKKNSAELQALNIQHVEVLENPVWKKSFRVLDDTKEIYVEQNDQGRYLVCLRFPFSLKKKFETDYLSKINHDLSNTWNYEKKLHIIDLYRANLVLLNEFVTENKFIINESFLEALSVVEEAWDNQHQIVPHSKIFKNSVILKNASEDALTFWNQNVSGIIERDLLLAKMMGFILKLDGAPQTKFEKIASCRENFFWDKDFSTFFEIYKHLQNKCAIILDRSDDILPWLDKFVESADSFGVSRSLIKICFRDDTTEENKINQWIKENSLGGKIQEGKIFIFRYKPAKWLFSKDLDVNVIATNSIFPMTNLTTQKWLESKSIVLHLGPIKSSALKETKIVEL